MGGFLYHASPSRNPTGGLHSSTGDPEKKPQFREALNPKSYYIIILMSISSITIIVIIIFCYYCYSYQYTIMIMTASIAL